MHVYIYMYNTGIYINVSLSLNISICISICVCIFICSYIYKQPIAFGVSFNPNRRS